MGDFERKWDLGRPDAGSALHHLVTAFSVKKALIAYAAIELSLPCGGPGWCSTHTVNGKAKAVNRKKRKGVTRSIACRMTTSDNDPNDSSTNRARAPVFRDF